MIQYLLLLLIPSLLLFIYDYFFNIMNGPLPVPLLGNINLLTINTHNIFERLTSYFSKYGNVFRIYIAQISVFHKLLI